MGRRKTGHKIDKMILEYLRVHRRATPRELVNVFGKDPGYIVRRLGVLVSEGKIRRVVMGLYEIVEEDEVKTKGA